MLLTYNCIWRTNIIQYDDGKRFFFTWQEWHVTKMTQTEESDSYWIYIKDSKKKEINLNALHALSSCCHYKGCAHCRFHSESLQHMRTWHLKRLWAQSARRALPSVLNKGKHTHLDDSCPVCMPLVNGVSVNLHLYIVESFYLFFAVNGDMGSPSIRYNFQMPRLQNRLVRMSDQSLTEKIFNWDTWQVVGVF